MPATAVLLAKIAELEASLQSTENYWKSKYENAEAELDGFKSICNEYLCGPEASWQDLSNWCEDKTDEIVEIREELEELEEQVADLKAKYVLNNPINQRLVEAGMSPLSSEEAGDILKRIGQ